MYRPKYINQNQYKDQYKSKSTKQIVEIIKELTNKAKLEGYRYNENRKEKTLCKIKAKIYGRNCSFR
jgi:hypothetical protein